MQLTNSNTVLNTAGKCIRTIRSMFVPLSTNAGGKRHLRRRYSTESRMKRQSKIVCILVTEEEEEIANSIRVYYVKTNDVPKGNIDRQNLRLGKTVLKTRGK